MKNRSCFLLWLLLLAPARLFGQTSSELTIDSGDFTFNNHNNSTALSSGTSAQGDGDVIQIGYYTEASTSNLFAGTWVPITGQGGANLAYNSTSIGDGDGAGDGTFAFSLTFTTGSATTGTFPASGQILALRYYNGTSLAVSTYYGALSDSSWKWASPTAITPDLMSFSPDDPGVAFLNNNVAFTGTALEVPSVPEPSGMLLFCVGFGILALRLRYRNTGRLISKSCKN